MVKSTGPYAAPPVLPPTWAYTPEAIAEQVSKSIAASSALFDKIAAIPKEQCTFESVVRPLALRMGEMDKEAEPPIFLQYVSTDAAVRDAAVAGDKELQEYSLSSVTRVDIYERLVAALAHTDDPANGVTLNPEERRLLERMILDRTRNGLGLSEQKRAKLLDLKKKIMSIEVDFQRHCNEENGSLLFTAEELDGVPKDTVASYPKETVDGVEKYKVTFKTPDIIPVFKYANQPSTRKAAVLGYEGKTLQNVPLLSEVVKLRKQAAELLGYKNHAELILEVKMAKTPEAVSTFLEDLRTKLLPLGEAEKVKLLALKKETHEALGLAPDSAFNLWDYRYYDRLWTEKHLALDDEAVAAYFPVSHIVPGVLALYKDLLSVEFIPVPRDQEHGGQTWHEEAEMYAVWDAGQAEGHFLGYMHLDLFPRPNKYGHAAVWGLIPGWTTAEGERSYPVVSMVANLSKPTPSRPALMKHQDVVTFQHELGHALHGLCSKTQFAKFHGTAVARDFVEAPSQMLENWTWTPAQLKSLSSHYETGKQLPDEIISAIVKSKNVNQGLFNLRQLFHGIFDMRIHTTEPVDADLTKLWCDLREEVSLVSTGGTYVGGQSGFAHIMGGYSCGYYGYLYSQSFSVDMFESVFAADPMSAKSGKLYRDEILVPGGSRDEMDSLKAFLGREPSNEPFLKSLLAGQEA